MLLERIRIRIRKKDAEWTADKVESRHAAAAEGLKLIPFSTIAKTM